MSVSFISAGSARIDPYGSTAMILNGTINKKLVHDLEIFLAQRDIDKLQLDTVPAL